jgi:hypothetical protein
VPVALSDPGIEVAEREPGRLVAAEAPSVVDRLLLGIEMIGQLVSWFLYGSGLAGSDFRRSVNLQSTRPLRVASSDFTLYFKDSSPGLFGIAE